jgi:predicted O-linked N-acetylglucosamine transferase (SPINDLY family)
VRELFERHDRSRFEVIGYSLGADDGGAERLALAASLDRLVDLRELDDIAAATRIHADGIDILVDLKGYTSGARTAILAQRPAPIQVNFLGYPGTMGVDFIDYLIADPIVVPLDRQAFYDERIVHLPDCYQPNDARRHDAIVPRGRAAFGLPETGFVFCCFNAPWKLTPILFTLWMRLLAATSDSVLWLLGAGGPAADNLRQTAADHGVAPERLIFAGNRPPEEHLARQHAADLFLDTLPYNAHTTALEALWAGVPVITCRGRSFAGRVGASVLEAAGLPELVCANLAAYHELAARLARSPADLAQLRDKVARARHTARAFDTARYARDFEAALHGMARGISH